MIVFEIELNGESLGTTGANDLSVLTAIVSAVGKLGPHSTGAHQREHHYDVELAVGGLTSRAEGSPDEHLLVAIPPVVAQDQWDKVTSGEP